MSFLVIGLLIFIGVHLTRVVAPRFRERQIESLGEGPWKGIYAMASLGGLALAIWGWTQYRLDAPEIYMPFGWAVHLTALLVLIGFILTAAAYAPSGHIKVVARHPMMIGVLFWAVGHLLANGDLASLILFGALGIYCIWYLIAVRQRQEPAPVFASYTGDLIAVIGGGIFYVVFAFWIHGLLFKVNPF